MIEIQIKVTGANAEELTEELTLLLEPIINKIIQENSDQEATTNDEKTE